MAEREELRQHRVNERPFFKAFLITERTTVSNSRKAITPTRSRYYKAVFACLSCANVPNFLVRPEFTQHVKTAEAAAI